MPRKPTVPTILHDEDDYKIPWWVGAIAITGLVGSVVVLAVLIWALINLVAWVVAQ